MHLNTTLVVPELCRYAERDKRSRLIKRTATLLGLIVIVVGLYVKIFLIARKHTQFISNMSRDHKQSNMQKSSANAKTLKTIGLVLGAFIGMWLPLLVMYFLEYFLSPSLLGTSSFITFNLVSNFLSYCNSAVNPFIYFFHIQSFRAAFISLFCCQKCKSKIRRVSNINAISETT